MYYPQTNTRATKEIGADIVAALQLQAKSSERTARISLAISLCALLIASLSLFFAYRDSVDDAEWKKQQIELLKEIASIRTTAEPVK